MHSKNRQDVCSTYIPSHLKGEGKGEGKEFDELISPPLMGGDKGEGEMNRVNLCIAGASRWVI